jgi:hypothetical protein
MLRSLITSATFGRKYFASDMMGGFGKVLNVVAGPRIVRSGAVWVDFLGSAR